MNRTMAGFIIFIALLSAFARCGGDEGNLLQSDPQAHVTRSRNGLAAWQISALPSSAIGYARNTDPDYVYNPPNWVAVTNESYVGEGIPDSFRQADDFADPAVLGITEWRYDGGTGEIVDTTVLIRDSFIVDAAFSEAEKQSVYTHELGHAFGLVHSALLADIMYPTTAGSNTPSSAELAAISDAYNYTPIGTLSSGNLSYFSKIGSIAITHRMIPTFVIYHPDMGHIGVEVEAPPGEPIKGAVITVRQYLYRDGSEKTEIMTEYR